jgi:hypothetical protein
MTAIAPPAAVPAIYQQDFQSAVNRAAHQYDVPAGPLGQVVAAVIGHESSWQPKAMHQNSGGSTDRGLAQINSAAHPDVTAAQAYTPAFALDWAAGFLAQRYARTGSWSQAVQSYNPGAPGYAQAVLAGVQLPAGGTAATKLAARSPTTAAAVSSASASGDTAGSSSGFRIGGFGGAGVPWWLQLGLVVGGALLIYVALKRIF